MNYEIAKKIQGKLSNKTRNLLICDESHYLKNYKSERTKAVLKISKKCIKVICMTGTPIMNRPVELLTQLEILGNNAMEGFNKSRRTFLNRYCLDDDGHYAGARNLEELQEILRSNVMVMRHKKDVLKDLPPKMRKIITLEKNEAVLKEQKEL